MFVDYVELGKRIAERRKELGLRQNKVNEMAELSDKYLSNIETARSIPSIDVLMRICHALETTPDHLLLGAVKEEYNSDMNKLIMDKISKLSVSKQKLIYRFIDLLEDCTI